MRLICHLYHQLRTNAVRQYSTIHWENTQAVVTTPVALRLLALRGKRLVTRLLGLKGEWAGVVGFSLNRGGSHGVRTM
jgi:hypothetical protein